MNEKHEYEVKQLNRFIIIQGTKIKELIEKNPNVKRELEESKFKLELIEFNLDSCIREATELKDVYDQNFKLNTKIIELNSELGY